MNTPTNRYWGFSSNSDPIFVEAQSLLLQTLTLQQYGNAVNMPKSNPIYNGTHVLVTNYNCSDNHSCVAANNGVFLLNFYFLIILTNLIA